MLEQVINPITKDDVQIIAWIAAIVFGLLAATFRRPYLWSLWPTADFPLYDNPVDSRQVHVLSSPGPPRSSRVSCSHRSQGVSLFDRFHHCINAKLISLQQMRYHMSYYVDIMAEFKEDLERFLEKDYDDTIRFLNRFREWRRAPKARRDDEGSSENKRGVELVGPLEPTSGEAPT